MRDRDLGVLCFLAVCWGGEDSKSYLEGGDLGVQALAWDVWASDITAPGSHSNSCVLEGDEVLTAGWNM